MKMGRNLPRHVRQARQLAVTNDIDITLKHGKGNLESEKMHPHTVTLHEHDRPQSVLARK